MMETNRTADLQLMTLIRSLKRAADHGEVFTPNWLVENMLDLVKGESERIDSRFLEGACGSGNFLVPVLKRKLAAVEAKYSKSDFEKRQFALLAVMCTYGIELLEDNIVECRANMLEVFADYLNLDETDEVYLAAHYVLSQNLVHGDALTMLMDNGQPDHLRRVGLPRQRQVPAARLSFRSSHPNVFLQPRRFALCPPRQARNLYPHQGIPANDCARACFLGS